MTDIDRVRQMVQSGRITADEGERLIAVLEDAKAADEELQRTDEQLQRADEALSGEAHSPETGAEEAGLEIERSGAPLPPVEVALEPPPPVDPAAPPAPAAPAAPAAPPAPPAPAAPPAPVAPAAPKAPGDSRRQPAPDGTRWVHLEALAGDLIVRVDESLESPTIETDGPGDAGVETSEEGFRVTWNRPSGSFLDNLLGRLKTGNLSMRLPKGYGLDLAASAGNVTLHDVPYLRGQLTAGNLKATGLKGVDFSGRAGNLNAEVELTAGSHQLRVTAGNVDVKLAPTSDVKVKAEASIGDVRSRIPGLGSTNGGIGGSLEGAYGSGAASLDVRVTTGNIMLAVDDG